MAATRRPPALARVLERVTATMRTHDMVEPGDLVLVWVSGGPDSVCLLESLVRLRRLFKIRLAVFHLDHRLRPGSASDAAYVRRLAARHGLSCHVRQAPDAPGKGVSVEAWARLARRRAAAEVASAIGATRHADGHTLDDQAETVLMALVLGRGLDGLRGIAPVQDRLVRPLFDVTRAEVEECCRALGLRPRLDPTNDDISLLRNALRLEAIPALERVTGRSITDTFARTAAHLRRDAAALTAEAAGLADRLAEQTEGRLTIPADELAALPEAVGTRVVRLALGASGATWDEPTIRAVIDLAQGRPGRRRDLAGGSTAWRDRRYVHIGVAPASAGGVHGAPHGEEPT